MKLKWTYELIVYIISKMNHEVKLIWFVFTIWDIYIIHSVVSTLYSVHLKIIVWDASIHHTLHSAGSRALYIPIWRTSPHSTWVWTFYWSISINAFAQDKQIILYTSIFLFRSRGLPWTAVDIQHAETCHGSLDLWDGSGCKFVLAEFFVVPV